jgi:hypothetical protein
MIEAFLAKAFRDAAPDSVAAARAAPADLRLVERTLLADERNGRSAVLEG